MGFMNDIEYGKILNAEFKKYKLKAKQEGCKFLLDKEYFARLLFGCFNCGDFEDGEPIEIATIVREDEKLDYSWDNVESICKTCSKIRSFLTVKEHDKHVKRVYRHLAGMGMI